MAANHKLNLTMLCDFYELTMGNGYFKHGYKDRICYFDVFFRRCPDNGGFAIAAGLEQIIDYIKDLHFTAEDIEYLRQFIKAGFAQKSADFGNFAFRVCQQMCRHILWHVCIHGAEL